MEFEKLTKLNEGLPKRYMQSISYFKNYNNFCYNVYGVGKLIKKMKEENKNSIKNEEISKKSKIRLTKISQRIFPPYTINRDPMEYIRFLNNIKDNEKMEVEKKYIDLNKVNIDNMLRKVKGKINIFDERKEKFAKFKKKYLKKVGDVTNELLKYKKNKYSIDEYIDAFYPGLRNIKNALHTPKKLVKRKCNSTSNIFINPLCYDTFNRENNTVEYFNLTNKKNKFKDLKLNSYNNSNLWVNEEPKTDFKQIRLEIKKHFYFNDTKFQPKRLFSSSINRSIDNIENKKYRCFQFKK